MTVERVRLLVPEDSPGLTCRQIAARSDLAHRTIEAILQRLRREGRIVVAGRVPAGRGGSTHANLYRRA